MANENRAPERRLVVNVAQGGIRPDGYACGSCKWGCFTNRYTDPVCAEELRKFQPDVAKYFPDGWPAGMGLNSGECRLKPIVRTREPINGIHSWCGQWTKP